MQTYQFKDENFVAGQNQFNVHKSNNIFLNESLLLEPLYKKIKLPDDKLCNILPYYNGGSPKLEMYCPKCKIKRVFKFSPADPKYVLGETGPVLIGSMTSFISNPKPINHKESFLKNTNYFYLYALSDCGHHIVINFKVIDENTVMKIGQYPSIYDLNEKISNKEFLKQLDDEYRNYYKSACSLHSFNTNIGAMTYLRRIFEKLLIDTFIENKKDENIDDFKKLRMENKIDNLKVFLPEIIFEQGFCELYKLISEGIHNLNEEQCNTNFETLKLAIEEILIEKLNKEQEKKRKETLKKQLQSIN